MPNTNHSEDIKFLRSEAESGTTTDNSLVLAADLLELHDNTGISLDNWASAREYVEILIGHPIKENGV